MHRSYQGCCPVSPAKGLRLLNGTFKIILNRNILNVLLVVGLQGKVCLGLVVPVNKFV